MKLYLSVTVVMWAMMLAVNIAWAADGTATWAGYGSSGQNGQGCYLAEGSCDGCSAADCCPQRCWGVVAGVEATYLKPNIRGEGVVFDPPYEIVDSGELVNFTDLMGSPRVWLGIETESGWGIRSRFWEFTATKSKDELSDFGRNSDLVEVVSANNRLHVYAVDVEATRRFESGDWCWLASFGVRNTGLKIGHNFDLLDLAPLQTDDNIDTAVTTNTLRQLDATGLTSSLEARRPFGTRGLAFAWNVRGSVLWGNDKALGNSRIIVLPEVDVASLAAVQEGTTQYIFETQVGVEWSRRIECLRGCAFAHAMFEYQRWTADERRASFEMHQRGGGITLDLTSIESNIDFAGLAFAIGFTR